MKQYSEAFVAFDVAKTKHSVAIAEGGAGARSGFWERSRTHLQRSSEPSGNWRTAMVGYISVSKPVPPAMGCIDRSRN